MTAPVPVAGWPMCVAGPVCPVDRLIDILARAEEEARELLDEELGDDERAGDPPAPAFALLDQAGRAIVDVLLAREPGTNRFTITLTTTEEL